MKKLLFTLPLVFLVLITDAQPFQQVYTGSELCGNGRRIDWGDYDNDGDVDLVVAMQEDTTYHIVVNMYRNDGNDQFYYWEVYTQGTSGNIVMCKFADLNNDSIQDVVFGFNGASSGNGTFVLEGNGSGGFLAPQLLSVQSGATALGDFDNDGDLDYAVGGYPTRIYSNNGNMSFTALPATLPNENLYSVSWGFIDGDTLLDLVTSGEVSLGDYHTRVYTNNGNSTFTQIVDLGDYRAYSIHIADFDEDSDNDIFITSVFDYSLHRTKMFRNDGAGVFDTLPQFLTGVNGSSDCADINGDGHLDVLAIGLNYDIGGCIVRMFEGDGTGMFNELNLASSIMPEYSALDLADYNSDSLIDLAVCGEPWPNNGLNPVRIYRNNFGLGMEEQSVSQYHLFPSITESTFTFTNSSASLCKVEIINAVGELVGQCTVYGSSTTEFSLQSEAPGMYFVRVVSGDTVNVLRVIRE